MASVLRDSAQVAVDDASLAALRLALDYRDAAGLADDRELGALFFELAGEHRVLARQLAAAARQLGALPSEPDPDRESLLKLFRHARSALSHERRLALLREAERHEEALGDRIAAALEQELGAARPALEAAAESATAARARLLRARLRLIAES